MQRLRSHRASGQLDRSELVQPTVAPSVDRLRLIRDHKRKCPTSCCATLRAKQPYQHGPPVRATRSDRISIEAAAGGGADRSVVGVYKAESNADLFKSRSVLGLELLGKASLLVTESGGEGEVQGFHRLFFVPPGSLDLYI